MYIDFKVTTWERAHLPDDLTPEQIKDLKDKIKRGVLCNWNDLEEEVGVITNPETLYELEEYISPEENGYEPTVEFYSDSGQVNPDVTNTQRFFESNG